MFKCKQGQVPECNFVWASRDLLYSKAQIEIKKSSTRSQSVVPQCLYTSKEHTESRKKWKMSSSAWTEKQNRWQVWQHPYMDFIHEFSHWLGDHLLNYNMLKPLKTESNTTSNSTQCLTHLISGTQKHHLPTLHYEYIYFFGHHKQKR